MASRDVINITVNVVVSILIAAKLGLYEVGIFALARTIASSLESIFRFPTDTLIPRAIANSGIRDNEFKSYLLIIFYQSLILICVYIFSIILSLGFDFGLGIQLVSIVFGTVYFRFFRIACSYLLIGIKDFKSYNIGLLIFSGSTAILIILYYVLDRISVKNVLFAFLISEIIAGAYFYMRTRLIISEVLRFAEKPSLRSIIHTEFSLYKAQVLTYVSNNASVYIIAASSIENLGVFHILKSIAESSSKVFFSAFVNVHSVSLFSIINKNKRWRGSAYIKEFWRLVFFMILLGVIFNVSVYLARDLYREQYAYNIYLFGSVLMFGVLSGAKLFFHTVLNAKRKPEIIYRNTLYIISTTMITIIGLYVLQLPMYLSYSIITFSTLIISFVSYYRIK